MTSARLKPLPRLAAGLLLSLVSAAACERPVEPAPAPAETAPAASARPAARADKPAPRDIPEPTPAPAGDEAARTRGTVVLVPLKSFPEDLIADIETSLAAEFGVEVARYDIQQLPKEAYYPPRKRYRAEKLLDFLEELPPAREPDTKLLGLTEVDISTTNEPHEDWGIFGLGRMPGRVAVLSSKRLKRKAKDRAHVIRRVRITALHEIGHTFGLDHCPEQRCLMQDAEGSIKNTDTASGTLEPGCRAKLERNAPLR